MSELVEKHKGEHFKPIFEHYSRKFYKKTTEAEQIIKCEMCIFYREDMLGKYCSLFGYDLVNRKRWYECEPKNSI